MTPFWKDKKKYKCFKNTSPEEKDSGRDALLRHSCDQIKDISGDIAEFGVKSGGSLRVIINATEDSRQYFGFDSFEGMPASKYPTKYKKGKFKVKEIPKFDSKNVNLIKGWFSDTLKEKHFDQLCFVHIDCDIYESTVLALDYCYPFLVNNSVIQFDEIHSVKANFMMHEYKAWTEFVEKNQLKYEVVGFTEKAQASFQIKL